ncbi:hypothetical protein CVT24_006533 [Panaeolus cyanescens]|uniref:BTB domain-containing protein n=1 Tax=Panaeolus cyanescens TaxID=181874 RepID=A0A409WZC9_9AGAR|nr:hypothetical protein CVT24_006533 [Panaeolus cyanescens]
MSSENAFTKSLKHEGSDVKVDDHKTGTTSALAILDWSPVYCDSSHGSNTFFPIRFRCLPANKAQDTLFRIPIYMFIKESQIFTEEFKLCDVDTAQKSLTIRNLPPDVPAAHFSALPHLLYPKTQEITFSLTKTQWLNALSLATRWSFLRVRSMIIKELDRLQTLKRLEPIIRGCQLKIVDWVQRGYEELIKQSTFLTEDEADAIGAKTAFLISRLREARSQSKPSSKPEMFWPTISYHGELICS